MRRRLLQALLRFAGGLLAPLDRLAVVHWAIVRAMGPAIGELFDAQQAHELHATLELAVRNPRGGEPTRFELAIRDGACKVRRDRASDPGAFVSAAAGDLIRLTAGRVGWPELLSAGRLELSGDPFLALRFPALFRLPASARIQ